MKQSSYGIEIRSYGNDMNKAKEGKNTKKTMQLHVSPQIFSVNFFASFFCSNVNTGLEKLFTVEKLGELRPRQSIYSEPTTYARAFAIQRHDPPRLILSTPINIDTSFFVLHGRFVPFY